MREIHRIFFELESVCEGQRIVESFNAHVLSNERILKVADVAPCAMPTEVILPMTFKRRVA